MSYFHETTWKGVPKFLRLVDTTLKNIGIDEWVPYNAPLIQFSSWMGGDQDEIGALLAKYSSNPESESQLKLLLPQIASSFGGNKSVKEIVEELQKHQLSNDATVAEWAKDALTGLGKGAPFSLSLTQIHFSRVAFSSGKNDNDPSNMVTPSLLLFAYKYYSITNSTQLMRFPPISMADTIWPKTLQSDKFTFSKELIWC